MSANYSLARSAKAIVDGGDLALLFVADHKMAVRAILIEDDDAGVLTCETFRGDTLIVRGDALIAVQSQAYPG